jgi:hypothetical protein
MSRFTNRSQEVPFRITQVSDPDRISALERQVADLQNQVSFLRTCCQRLFNNDYVTYAVLTDLADVNDLPGNFALDFIPFEKVTAPQRIMGWTMNWWGPWSTSSK